MIEIIVVGIPNYSLTSVQPKVRRESARLCEGLAACVAGVGFVARVHPKVRRYGARRRAGLSARCALMNAGSVRPRLRLTVAFDIFFLGLLAGAFADAVPPWISLLAVGVFSLHGSRRRRVWRRRWERASERTVGTRVGATVGGGGGGFSLPRPHTPGGGTCLFRGCDRLARICSLSPRVSVHACATDPTVWS
jgi:hypothetical protein